MLTPFTFNLVDSPKDMQKNNYAPLTETGWDGYILVNRIHIFIYNKWCLWANRIKTIKSSLIPGFTLVGCGAWSNVETVIYRIASRRLFSIARRTYLPVSMVMTMMNVEPMFMNTLESYWSLDGAGAPLYFVLPKPTQLNSRVVYGDLTVIWRNTEKKYKNFVT